ncbi:MAG TPA: transcription termination/antitermination NusG family protein [Bryobacteraceae bacterium]|nr:transcription termination/antitermination NusG family protein [Bryobacteraceae bacterium]
MDTRDWFAVQVWSRREHICAKHLRQRGYEVFLPCYRERRRWSDRIKIVDRALFPGYLFCRFQPFVSATIIATPEVLGIVGDGCGPLPVARQEIEAIQRIVSSNAPAEPWPLPHTGEKVRIEVGPLRGLEGVLLRAKSHHRLVVLVSLLQRAIAVEVDSNWIIGPQHAAAVGM